MKIHLFGASSITGIAFKKNAKLLSKKFEIITYSRNNNFDYLIDLKRLEYSSKSINLSEESIFVSFAPIWIFSEFLVYIYKFYPNKLNLVKKIIVCSSSSVISKRFAFCNHDKELVKLLLKSEKQINELTLELRIPTTFLRPSMIYGEVEKYKDKNISKILFMIRFLPILPLPCKTGLRQPIHIDQLSKVALSFVEEFVNSKDKLAENKFILIGGDMEISFKNMIILLQKSLRKNDRGKKCIILSIPNKLFFTLLFPVFWISPKLYESLLRISADLAGYTLSSQILKSKSYVFPFRPYI